MRRTCTSSDYLAFFRVYDRRSAIALCLEMSLSYMALGVLSAILKSSYLGSMNSPQHRHPTFSPPLSAALVITAATRFNWWDMGSDA